jgi:PAS domain S-box-containing protein
MNSIMIVEDDGLIALDLKKKLEQAGYAVPTVADNSAEALIKVESLRPSLVLMDIRLRGPQDGIETADQIRRRFHVPVIFVTAHADSQTLDRARSAEPFGYIVKPFHSVDFRAQIEMALWKHKMDRMRIEDEAWPSATLMNPAYAVIAADGKGMIAFINPSAERLTGWKRNDCRSKPLRQVLRIFETTDLADMHPIDAIAAASEPGGIPRTFRLTRQGCSAPAIVETELFSNYEGGSLRGIVVVFHDAAEQRAAEEHGRKLQKLNALALSDVDLKQELAQAQGRLDAGLTQSMGEARVQMLRLLARVFAELAGNLRLGSGTNCALSGRLLTAPD